MAEYTGNLLEELTAMCQRAEDAVAEREVYKRYVTCGGIRRAFAVLDREKDVRVLECSFLENAGKAADLLNQIDAFEKHWDIRVAKARALDAEEAL